MHNRKATRHIPFIDATFKVHLFLGFENYGNSLLHIKVFCTVWLLVQYLKSDYEANCQRLKATHPKSRSYLTNRLYCGRSIRDIATEDVLAQRPTISPPKRVNFQIMFFIHAMFFFFRISKSFRTGSTSTRLKDTSNLRYT